MSYDPVQSLREEIERFEKTNTFNAMLVTNFYVQARVVLRMLEEANKSRDAAIKDKESYERSYLQIDNDYRKSLYEIDELTHKLSSAVSFEVGERNGSPIFIDRRRQRDGSMRWVVNVSDRCVLSKKSGTFIWETGEDRDKQEHMDDTRFVEYDDALRLARRAESTWLAAQLVKIKKFFTERLGPDVLDVKVEEFDRSRFPGGFFEDYFGKYVAIVSVKDEQAKTRCSNMVVGMGLAVDIRVKQ